MLYIDVWINWVWLRLIRLFDTWVFYWHVLKQYGNVRLCVFRIWESKLLNWLNYWRIYIRRDTISSLIDEFEASHGFLNHGWLVMLMQLEKFWNWTWFGVNCVYDFDYVWMIITSMLGLDYDRSSWVMRYKFLFVCLGRMGLWSFYEIDGLN